MNRVGFMSQLEGLLVDIPAAEREEALQYYNDYFDDAGAENEQSVISSLGSPKAIAENIKAEIKGEMIPTAAKASDGAITKYGQIVTANNGQNANGANAYDRSYNDYYDARPLPRKNKIPVWALVLIIIGLIVVAPAVFGVLAGIVGLIIGIVATWFGIIIAGGAATFGLLVAAIVLFFVAFLTLTISPAVLIGVLGVSMLCGSLGLFGLMITVWLAGKATPAILKWCGICIRFLWRGIGKAWRKIF